jgi:hypothetical protein
VEEQGPKVPDPHRASIRGLKPGEVIDRKFDGPLAPRNHSPEPRTLWPIDGGRTRSYRVGFLHTSPVTFSVSGQTEAESYGSTCMNQIQKMIEIANEPEVLYSFSPAGLFPHLGLIMSEWSKCVALRRIRTKTHKPDNHNSLGIASQTITPVALKQHI